MLPASSYKPLNTDFRPAFFASFTLDLFLALARAESRDGHHLLKFGLPWVFPAHAMCMLLRVAGCKFPTPGSVFSTVSVFWLRSCASGTFKVDIANTEQLLAGEQGKEIKERGILVRKDHGRLNAMALAQWSCTEEDVPSL